jgi:hypothetical protein
MARGKLTAVRVEAVFVIEKKHRADLHAFKASGEVVTITYVTKSKVVQLMYVAMLIIKLRIGKKDFQESLVDL